MLNKTKLRNLFKRVFIAGKNDYPDFEFDELFEEAVGLSLNPVKPNDFDIFFFLLKTILF